MSNNNGSSADIDSHISKKYEIRRRLGKVTIMMMTMTVMMLIMMMLIRQGENHDYEYYDDLDDLMMLTAISY